MILHVTHELLTIDVVLTAHACIVLVHVHVLVRHLRMHSFIQQDEVRSQDTVFVIGGVTGTADGREMAWRFLQERWATLHERYSGGFLLARLIQVSQCVGGRAGARAIDDVTSRVRLAASERSSKDRAPDLCSYHTLVRVSSYKWSCLHKMYASNLQIAFVYVHVCRYTCTCVYARVMIWSEQQFLLLTVYDEELCVYGQGGGNRGRRDNSRTQQQSTATVFILCVKPCRCGVRVHV